MTLIPIFSISPAGHSSDRTPCCRLESPEILNSSFNRGASAISVRATSGMSCMSMDLNGASRLGPLIRVEL